MGKLRKTTISMICIAEALIIIVSTAACAAKDGGVAPHELVQPDEIQQETVQSKEIQQETVQPKETMQTAARPNTAQQDTKQPEQNGNEQNGNEQISLEDAKSAALADAGLSSSEVIYTEEKLDYEDGIVVYEIEFYAGDADYEYEIDAATGEVYSKSVETHHNRSGHGHKGH